MQHVRKIGSTRIVRGAARSGQDRAENPVRAWALAVGRADHRAGASPDRRAFPAEPVRSDMQEAKTDAGHRRAWLCGCHGAAQPLGSDVRAHGLGEGRRRPWGGGANG